MIEKLIEYYLTLIDGEEDKGNVAFYKQTIDKLVLMLLDETL